MADSAVNITEGTGTAIDTRTEDGAGQHRQVIVIGDPSANAGVAPVDGTAGLKVNLGADNDVTVTGLVEVSNPTDVSGLALETGGNLDLIVAGVAAIAGYVDGVEAALSSLAVESGGNLAAIATAVQVIDNAISGSEMQVDVVGPLPAGDNNIGNVDIVTVPADPFGVNADAASATGSISAKLRASAVALEVIDDWDESDRAKVNVIVGQAGITAGAGSVAANTPRVTHASDDPVTLALQIMDDWDETDRAKVNIIAGQAGVAAGAGAVGATVQRVTLASDDPLVATAGSSEYETVAAGASAQTIGPTGATGDYLDQLLAVPASVSPGGIWIIDNTTSINVFAGGTNAVATLHPFPIPIHAKSVSGAWKVSTGTSISVIAFGNFT